MVGPPHPTTACAQPAQPASSQQRASSEFGAGRPALVWKSDKQHQSHPPYPMSPRAPLVCLPSETTSVLVALAGLTMHAHCFRLRGALSWSILHPVLGTAALAHPRMTHGFCCMRVHWRGRSMAGLRHKQGVWECHWPAARADKTSCCRHRDKLRGRSEVATDQFVSRLLFLALLLHLQPLLFLRTTAASSPTNTRATDEEDGARHERARLS